MFSKVITHNTAFHADDVLAVAMLRYANFEFELVRTRTPSVLADAIADSNTLILDVGGVFNPSMLNFDHHQDMSLVSAAGMIWEHFKDSICPYDAQLFFGQFVASIDAIDTNRNNIYAVWNTLPEGFRNTSNILSGFNRDVMNAAQQDNQFNRAVDFAIFIIENERNSAIEKAKSERQYGERSILPNNVAVFDEFSIVWKEKGEHQFAVLPHTNGWQIQSRDTAVATVPERVAECEGFIFRHGSGFMATVKEKSTAIAFAETL
jgi:uncharacterized UPF0160 family protein